MLIRDDGPMTVPNLLPSLAVLVTAAALSLFAAGCGGGSPGVAKIGTFTTNATTTNATTTPSGFLAHTHCMRSHGVPTFPDPSGSGVIPKAQIVAARKSSPSKFNAASAACSHLVPNVGEGSRQTAQNQRKQLEEELSLARCMRSHGVTNFPDPTAQGLTVAMVEAQGIDLQSPATLRVVQACLPATHGGLTMAKVRHAIADANAGG